MFYNRFSFSIFVRNRLIFTETVLLSTYFPSVSHSWLTICSLSYVKKYVSLVIFLWLCWQHVIQKWMRLRHLLYTYFPSVSHSWLTICSFDKTWFLFSKKYNNRRYSSLLKKISWKKKMEAKRMLIIEDDIDLIFCLLIHKKRQSLFRFCFLSINSFRKVFCQWKIERGGDTMKRRRIFSISCAMALFLALIFVSVPEKVKAVHFFLSFYHIHYYVSYST